MISLSNIPDLYTNISRRDAETKRFIFKKLMAIFEY
jgi:hypothetical protein